MVEPINAVRSVVCVDGVGTPSVIALVSEHGELPQTFGWARPYQATGPGRIVQFDRHERSEINGMPVYRQHDMGEPRIRFERIKPVESEPFNTPRTA